MSEATDKLINVASDQIAKFGDKISDMVHTYGPDTWKLVEATARIDAISSLIVCVPIFMTACIISYFIRPMWNWAYIKECRYNREDRVFVHILYMALTIGIWIVFLVFLLNVWAWAGIFEPKIWIAHKFLFN